MLNRWLFLAVVAVCVVAYVKAPQDGTADAAPATVSQACSAARPGTSTVTLAWPATQAGAQQTWFDISLAPGFAPGWFQGLGPLPASQTAYALDGVPQGLTYFYRVNTLYPDGWRATASGTFVSNCTGGGTPVTGATAQVCDASGGVTVTFNWQASAPGSQWLDLSIFNNGFAPGSFVGAGPVASGNGSFVWTGIARSTTHFWRVNALTASGWSTSNTGSFRTLSCQPPIKMCVGYLVGLSADGRAECDQLIAGADRNLADCVAYLLKVGGNDAACRQITGDGLLIDCLLGLSGGSHFGKVSCRLYYEQN